MQAAKQALFQHYHLAICYSIRPPLHNHNMMKKLIKKYLKNIIIDPQSIDAIKLNKEELGSPEYLTSFISTYIKMHACANKVKMNPESFFILRIVFYYSIPALSAHHYIKYTKTQKESHSHYSSETLLSCIDSSLEKENRLSSYLKTFQAVNRIRLINLYKSNSNKSEFILIESQADNSEKLEKAGYTKTNSIEIISQSSLSILVAKSRCSLHITLKYFYHKLVHLIEKIIYDYSIERLGTFQLMKKLSFIENPVYEACSNKGIISFGQQQRAFNNFQLEFMYGSFHEYTYYDTESMFIHSSNNKVLNPLIEGGTKELILKKNNRRIIAFPNEVTTTLCACSFNNLCVHKKFQDFLIELKKSGYDVVVKLKDHRDIKWWKNSGLTLRTSKRGGYHSILNEGFTCAISSLFATPGIEVAVHTDIPSYYFSAHVFPKSFYGYHNITISTPDELIKKIQASA